MTSFLHGHVQITDSGNCHRLLEISRPKHSDGAKTSKKSDEVADSNSKSAPAEQQNASVSSKPAQSAPVNSRPAKVVAPPKASLPQSKTMYSFNI